MQISGALTKIRRDAAFDLFAVYQMPLVVYIQDHPHMTGNGQLFANGWRQTYGSSSWDSLRTVYSSLSTKTP